MAYNGSSLWKLPNYRLFKLVRAGILSKDIYDKSKAFEALRILKNRKKIICG